MNEEPADLRERKRGIVFIVICLVSVVVFVWVVGPLGVIGAPALGLVLAYLYRRTDPGRRKPRPSVTGDVPCPKCGALQTDVVTDFDGAGEETQVFRCFRCDHVCDPADAGLPADPR